MGERNVVRQDDRNLGGRMGRSENRFQPLAIQGPDAYVIRSHQHVIEPQ